MSNADHSKRWRERHPERSRAAQRRYREQNPDKRAAADRRRPRRDPEKMRQWSMAAIHGRDVFAASAAMWDEQGGKCYLCGIYLVPERAFIDHDHRCCPSRRSCSFCRRGLACDYCNVLIGLAHDDPDVLRLIADNLEAKLAVIDARLASKPSQLTLGQGATS